MNDPELEAARKKAIRRNVILLVLVAVAFYVGFIVMTAMRSS